MDWKCYPNCCYKSMPSLNPFNLAYVIFLIRYMKMTFYHHKSGFLFIFSFEFLFYLFIFCNFYFFFYWSCSFCRHITKSTMHNCTYKLWPWILVKICIRFTSPFCLFICEILTRFFVCIVSNFMYQYINHFQILSLDFYFNEKG